MTIAWNADKATRLREAGFSWDEIAGVFGVTRDTVRCRIDPEYAERRRELRRESLKEVREISAAKKAGLSYSEGQRSRQAEQGWLRQINLMPSDTRTLTGVIAGDPIPGDPRCPWRPSSSMQQESHRGEGL